ncbi:MAG: hypothetical protein AAGH99_01110 [Planctomycetota bacterium]
MAIDETIIRSIRADGFAVSCTTWPESMGGQVAFLAWKSHPSGVRPPGAETWEGKGPDRYTAAVALAEAIGWEGREE